MIYELPRAALGINLVTFWIRLACSELVDAARTYIYFKDLLYITVASYCELRRAALGIHLVTFWRYPIVIFSFFVVKTKCNKPKVTQNNTTNKPQKKSEKKPEELRKRIVDEIKTVYMAGSYI